MVEQYNATVQIMMQQEESRLEGAVRVETGAFGRNEFFDQIDATAAVKRTARHADTPQISTPHLRRRVSLYDFDWADLIDNFDELKVVADPQGKYVQNAKFALNRSKDDEIIACLAATAYGGMDGSTTYTFDTANKQIVHGSAGLNLTKLLQAKQKLDTDEVDEADRFIVCGSKQIQDLLNVTEVKSSDYNTVKALANGEIDTYLGFKFIRSERLTLSSTTRYCYAWQKNTLLLAYNSNIITDIGPRRDKNMAIQVYAGMSIGATRMDEKGIVQIQCTES
jgi:hypothetical protein